MLLKSMERQCLTRSNILLLLVPVDFLEEGFGIMVLDRFWGISYHRTSSDRICSNIENLSNYFFENWIIYFIRGHSFVVLELHPQVMSFHRNCTAKMLGSIGTIRIEHGSIAAYITNELWSISKQVLRLLRLGRFSSHCEPVDPSRSFALYRRYVKSHIDVAEMKGTAMLHTQQYFTFACPGGFP